MLYRGPDRPRGRSGARHELEAKGYGWITDEIDAADAASCAADGAVDAVAAMAVGVRIAA